jgi:hypothetical protein
MTQSITENVFTIQKVQIAMRATRRLANSHFPYQCKKFTLKGKFSHFQREIQGEHKEQEA